MKTKRIPKWVRQYSAELRKRFLAFMADIGGVSVDGGSFGLDCNPYSGKWNHHAHWEYHDGPQSTAITVTEFFHEFKRAVVMVKVAPDWSLPRVGDFVSMGGTFLVGFVKQTGVTIGGRLALPCVLVEDPNGKDDLFPLASLRIINRDGVAFRPEVQPCV